MKPYQPRQVEFQQLLALNEWRIKIYTITHRETFQSRDVLNHAIALLPDWLANSARLGWPVHHFAVLIVHEGRDGVWTLINWWVDENMLQSMTFFTDDERPTEFVGLPQGTFMACVWEMAALNFEREAWIEHILQRAEQPDFTGYCHAQLNKAV